MQQETRYQERYLQLSEKCAPYQIDIKRALEETRTSVPAGSDGYHSDLTNAMTQASYEIADMEKEWKREKAAITEEMRRTHRAWHPVAEKWCKGEPKPANLDALSAAYEAAVAKWNEWEQGRPEREKLEAELSFREMALQEQSSAVALLRHHFVYERKQIPSMSEYTAFRNFLKSILERLEHGVVSRAMKLELKKVRDHEIDLHTLADLIRAEWLSFGQFTASDIIWLNALESLLQYRLEQKSILMVRTELDKIATSKGTFNGCLTGLNNLMIDWPWGEERDMIKIYVCAHIAQENGQVRLLANLNSMFKALYDFVLPQPQATGNADQEELAD